jgi:ABC-type multidrug transport system ATPase subunit
MDNSVIEVKDLRKTYSNCVAVDGISFDAKQGDLSG